MKSAINNQSSVFINQAASGLAAVAFGTRSVEQLQAWLDTVQIGGQPLPLSTKSYIITAAENLKFAISKLPTDALPGEGDKSSCQPPPIAS
jgi:hypothetical protein